MISLAEKFDVLHSHYVLGKGVKEIARELSLSKNTVRKYLREFSEQKAELLAGGDKSAILLAMTEKPKYNSHSRCRTVVTDDVVDVIRECLLDNEHKRALGNSKLCMKSKDIYELLVEKGFQISYPSVNNAVRLLEERTQEAFIKQHYEHGEVCEFDWGEVSLMIGGRSVTFRLAVFTLACSNIRYAALYRHEDTQAFVDAHIRFFRFMGGVPHTMVYDNMRVAIAKFVGKHEKVATIALKQLSTYYGFSYRFCNIRRGNEKGHVERSVEVVRRKSFSTRNEFDTPEAAAARLEITLERLNQDKAEQMELERAAMLEAMPDYTSVIRQNGIVDKFSTATYKQNHYSVPDYLVGREVEIHALVEEIVVKHHGREVARHRRSYENHTYTLDIMHYRETLSRKPGAVRNSLCLKQASELLRILFDQHFSHNPKEFILLLDLLEHYTLHQIHQVIDTLLESGAGISLDNIKMILGNRDAAPLLQMERTEPDPIEAACEAHLKRWVVA